MVKDHDIVLMHVWNHPALFELLVTKKLPPCRLLGWSHMAGTYAPYILFQKLIDYFDDFYYTSPISINNCGINCEYIWSSNSVSRFLPIKKEKQKELTIGYIGTLDYCKLHPDFIKILREIHAKIKNVRFIIIGYGTQVDELKKQWHDIPVEFLGRVPDISVFLSMFDYFLYPLNPNHQGTCEQILGEVMAAGVPSIVLDNPAEKIIIEHEKTGFICKNIDEIVRVLQKQPKLNDYDMKESALQKYSIYSTIRNWDIAFQKAMEYQPKERSWSENITLHPFIESLGPYSKIFNKYIYETIADDYYDLDAYIIPQMINLFRGNIHHWKSQDKGSIYQYERYFPDDIYLKKWREILDGMSIM